MDASGIDDNVDVKQIVAENNSDFLNIIYCFLSSNCF